MISRKLLTTYVRMPASWVSRSLTTSLQWQVIGARLVFKWWMLTLLCYQKHFSEKFNFLKCEMWACRSQQDWKQRRRERRKSRRQHHVRRHAVVRTQQISLYQHHRHMLLLLVSAICRCQVSIFSDASVITHLIKSSLMLRQQGNQTSIVHTFPPLKWSFSRFCLKGNLWRLQ